MHQTVSDDQLHQEKLPDTVKSCNASKVGVDVFDSMCVNIPAKVSQEGDQWLYFLTL